jgi:hypothetical protein
MPKRIIFVPAMLAVLVIVLTSRSGGAEPAGDNCIAKPNSGAPQGSHWYYRVDRAANRRCWFLGPEGLKVRQTESPKRLPSVTSTAQPTLERRAEATASLNGPVANVSASFPTLSKSTGSSEREPASSLNDNPAEHTTAEYVSLQFSPAAERVAEAAAAKQPPEVAVPERAAVSATAEEATFSAAGHMLATATGVLVLVAVLLLTIYRLFGIQRLGRRSKVRDQRRLVANAARTGKVLSPRLASKITLRRQADLVSESLSIPRCLNAAREPLNRTYTNHDIETDLRRLLYHSAYYHSQRRAA